MKATLICSVVAAILLTGCASDAENLAKDQLAVEAMRQDAAKEARAKLTEQLQDQLDEVVPSWYLEPPKM